MSSRSDDGVRAPARRRASSKRGDDEEDSDSTGVGVVSSSDPAAGSRSRGGGSKKTSSAESQEEGCVICKQDNDHPNLLLCEGCDVESHIYCLNPPLLAVPEGDWFCGKSIYLLKK